MQNLFVCDALQRACELGEFGREEVSLQLRWHVGRRRMRDMQ
jgi:hypothetical protein